MTENIETSDENQSPAIENGDVSQAKDAIFETLSPLPTAEKQHDINLILDVPVVMSVELGRTKLTIQELLNLTQGSIIALDGLADEPLDILINGYLIAQGEVVVVGDNYGVRITDIISPSERVRRVNR